MFWTASNALIGGSIIPLPSTLKKNVYHKHVKCSREEQRSGGCGEGSVLATSAHCQKIENHCGEQEGEWMSFAWRGRSDISTPTVCQSAFPVMYGCYMAPLTQQNQSILPCWGMLEHETMGACDPCYGMTKLREGGLKRSGLTKRRGEGGCFIIQYHIVCSPVVAFEKLHTGKQLNKNGFMDAICGCV